VGVTDQGYVAVFKGVPGSIAGFSLSEVDTPSTIKVDALTQVAQDRVRKGIAAETEAQQILSGLTSDNPANPNLLPTCGPSVAPSATAGTTTPSSAASAPATSATPADSVLTPAPCRS
jgi:PPM family protein phosphatase